MEASAQPATTDSARNVYRKPLASRLFPYFLVAPTLILVFVFTLWPTVQSVTGSLYRPPLTVRQQSKFVGLQNYVDLFDPEQSTRPDIAASFPTILVNTLVFTAATVVISVPLAFLFALLLNRKVRFLGLWRFSLFYPALLPVIGAASIWSFLYADNIGLANTVLRSLGLSCRQMARSAGDDAGFGHHRHLLEANRLLHDFLSGGIARDPARYL